VDAPAGFRPQPIGPRQPDWTEPIAPYHVIGNVHYVGSKGLAIYLITTPEGHILLNCGLESSRH